MAAKLRVLDNGTLREITRLAVRQAGVLRQLKTLKVMNGGTLRTVAIFASPLTVSASPAAAQADFGGSGVFPPQSLTTNLVTAIPSGGFAPYTYAWAYLSGSTFTVSHPTSSGTFFSHTFNAFGSRSGTYRCTVTDSFGSTASADVPVSIEFSF